MTSMAPITSPATAGVLDPPLAQAPTRDIELAIEGMTCAACAVRIEKKLNRLDDVRASVNYATGIARVTAPAGTADRGARRGGRPGRVHGDRARPRAGGGRGGPASR